MHNSKYGVGMYACFSVCVCYNAFHFIHPPSNLALVQEKQKKQKDGNKAKNRVRRELSICCHHDHHMVAFHFLFKDIVYHFGVASVFL